LQVSEYNKLTKRILARKRREINEIARRYSLLYPEWQLTEQFKVSTLSTFLDRLPKEEILEAWNLAYQMKPRDPVRYFCGICWKKIRGEE